MTWVMILPSQICSLFSAVQVSYGMWMTLVMVYQWLSDGIIFVVDRRFKDEVDMKMKLLAR